MDCTVYGVTESDMTDFHFHFSGVTGFAHSHTYNMAYSIEQNCLVSLVRESLYTYVCFISLLCSWTLK